ncbi:MAG: hypothetical protein NTW10_11090 [Bacteroidetes bacterium]|nr:hypothetical protein [Bacteroidota bacterium]
MKTVLVSFILCLSFFLLIISCNKKKDPPPCDNKGTICFNNKTDSTVTVTIKEAPDQFPLAKDNIKCVSLNGNVSYSITISGKNYEKDTAFIVRVCDDKEIMILR